MSKSKNTPHQTYGLTELQLEQIVGVFSNYKEINRVIIHGSRAKGSQKVYSDIDIAILGEDLNYSVLQKIEIELDDLMLPYKFDVSDYNTIDNEEMLDQINRFGKVLYKK